MEAACDKHLAGTLFMIFSILQVAILVPYFCFGIELSDELNGPLFKNNCYTCSKLMCVRKGGGDSQPLYQALLCHMN